MGGLKSKIGGLIYYIRTNLSWLKIGKWALKAARRAIKIIWLVIYFVYDLSGIRAIKEKIVPVSVAKQNSDSYRPPATIVLWLIAIYSAVYGISLNIYETRLDRLYNRTNTAVTLNTAKPTKASLQAIPAIQNLKVPTEPKFFEPFIDLYYFRIPHFSVFSTILGEGSYDYENRVTLSDLLLDNHHLFDDIDLKNVFFIDNKSAQYFHEFCGDLIKKTKSIEDFYEKISNKLLSTGLKNERQVQNRSIFISIDYIENIGRELQSSLNWQYHSKELKKINRAQFKEVTMVDSNSHGLYFDNCSFDRSNAIRSLFVNCIFNNCNFISDKEMCSFDYSIFAQCFFEKTNLSGANFIGSMFINPIFYQSILDVKSVNDTVYYKSALVDSQINENSAIPHNINLKFQKSLFLRVVINNLKDLHRYKADSNPAKTLGAKAISFDGSYLFNCDLRAAYNLSVEQLLKAKSLYKTRLPPHIEEKIRSKNEALLDKKPDFVDGWGFVKYNQ